MGKWVRVRILVGVIMRATLLLFFAFIFLRSSALATKAKLPPITEETVSGTWEAVSTDLFADFYVIKISRDGTSMLAWGRYPNSSLVCILQSLEVKNGMVKFIFKESPFKPSTYIDNGIPHKRTGIVRVEGEGVAGKGLGAFEENGVLDVKLILEPDSPIQSVTKLKFTKGEPSLMEALEEVSKAAYQALKTEQSQGK